MDGVVGTFSRRARARAWATVVAITCVAGLSVLTAAPASAASSARQIDALVRTAVRTKGLNAVIVEARVRGRTVIRRAYGQSMAGVPATVNMHFRNGNVAAMYMSTLLLRLVEQHKAKLDDPVSKYVRGIPDGSRVTLRMLAGMTSGYKDYVRAPGFATRLYGNPFAPWTTKEQLNLALGPPDPLQFTPGTNFAYAHTNYVILGLALEKITRLPLQTALSRYVLRPLGLRNTQASQTPAIPPPVLHTYSSERRQFLGIPAGTPFLEDSTFWNPSWTFARGSIETTDITDLTRTAIDIGQGRLLTRSDYRMQIAPRLGFGHEQDGCLLCRKLTPAAGYGLGVFRVGPWIEAQPYFGGLGSVMAYLPSKRIAISVVVALGRGAFSADGAPDNYSGPLFSQIAKVLAPGNTPPA
jgi:CubicO group peptidase (beta-lactamase class C family)